MKFFLTTIAILALSLSAFAGTDGTVYDSGEVVPNAGLAGSLSQLIANDNFYVTLESQLLLYGDDNVSCSVYNGKGSKYGIKCSLNFSNVTKISEDQQKRFLLKGNDLLFSENKTPFLALSSFELINFYLDRGTKEDLIKTADQRAQDICTFRSNGDPNVKMIRYMTTTGERMTRLLGDHTSIQKFNHDLGMIIEDGGKRVKGIRSHILGYLDSPRSIKSLKTAPNSYFVYVLCEKQ